MIIWIASYPKSGNTWIRALLSSYLFSDDGNFNFELLKNIEQFSSKNISLKLNKDVGYQMRISKSWIPSQELINRDKKIRFFKTHNACVSYKDRWFTDEINTAGYVYVVRDPRSIACSLASHSKISIEQAVNDLLNENNMGLNGPYKLAELPGSWKINYLSWKKKKNFEGIIIKYEDLIDNTENEFKKILVFLNRFKKINIDEKRISKSVISCDFSNLSKMEGKQGFEETQNNKFFRKGKKDSWKNELNLDLRKKLEDNFKSEMIELGYL